MKNHDADCKVLATGKCNCGELLRDYEVDALRLTNRSLMKQVSELKRDVTVGWWVGAAAGGLGMWLGLSFLGPWILAKLLGLG